MHLLSTVQVMDAMAAEQIFAHQLAIQTFSKAQAQHGAFDLRRFRGGWDVLMLQDNTRYIID